MVGSKGLARKTYSACWPSTQSGRERGFAGKFRSGTFHSSSATALRSLQFQSIRHKGMGSRGHDRGASFVIEFPEPVNGPTAVGYAALFGLDLFVPVLNLSSATNIGETLD